MKRPEAEYLLKLSEKVVATDNLIKQCGSLLRMFDACREDIKQITLEVRLNNDKTPYMFQGYFKIPEGMDIGLLEEFIKTTKTEAEVFMDSLKVDLSKINQ